MNKSVPFNKINIGDEILFKVTGKPATATAKVKDIKYYELTPEIVEVIRVNYGKEIGTDNVEDWQDTMQKKYCTLIWLEDVKTIKPIEVPRSNGAGWILLND